MLKPKPLTNTIENCVLNMAADALDYDTFSSMNKPQFIEGDRLRWIEEDWRDCLTDFGTVIGRFYGYLAHRQVWMWGYLIWLDNQSPSARWCRVDTAWEEDLERI